MEGIEHRSIKRFHELKKKYVVLNPKFKGIMPQAIAVINSWEQLIHIFIVNIVHAVQFKYSIKLTCSLCLIPSSLQAASFESGYILLEECFFVWNHRQWIKSNSRFLANLRIDWANQIRQKNNLFFKIQNMTGYFFGLVGFSNCGGNISVSINLIWKEIELICNWAHFGKTQFFFIYKYVNIRVPTGSNSEPEGPG